MIAVSAANVRAFILRELAEPLSAVGQSPDTVPDDFDLLAEGVIDSFGIVTMIASLEAHYETDLDLEQLAAEELTLIGPFSAFVAQQVSSNSGAA
jgi:acyl carrier protein